MIYTKFIYIYITLVMVQASGLAFRLPALGCRATMALLATPGSKRRTCPPAFWGFPEVRIFLGEVPLQDYTTSGYIRGAPIYANSHFLLVVTLE